MKVFIYLLIGLMVMLVIMTGITWLTTIIEVYTLGNRVEDSLIAAGWAGFSTIDLDKAAERIDIRDEELRNLYLDKSLTDKIVRDYIRENLKLDAANIPKDESYIEYRTAPVIIEDIEIFNPDDLPASCNRGVDIERTTIHIVVQIPMDIKWLGFSYLEKHVDVDVKSFFKD